MTNQPDLTTTAPEPAPTEPDSNTPLSDAELADVAGGIQARIGGTGSGYGGNDGHGGSESGGA